MWRLKKAIGRPCACALLSLLFWSPLGYCSEANAPEETVPREALMQVLSDWEQSNSELQKLLDAQESDLTIASEELQTLRDTLSKQKKELIALRNDLLIAKSETLNARISLAEANKELQNTAACVKDLENKKRRVERQRNFWEVVAGAICIVAVTR